MADANSIREELATAVTGKNLMLDGTVKFDFEPGIVYIDGLTESASVSDEDKDADCTLSMQCMPRLHASSQPIFTASRSRGKYS